MRTGNLRSLSEREWSSIREFREFDRQEREKQRLAEDQEQYRLYVEAVNTDQQRIPPRFKIAPLDFESWRSFTDEDQVDPVLRGQIATNRALLSIVNKDEALKDEAACKAIVEGKPDPAWRLPDSAQGLSMSVEQAKKFAATESQRFVDETPEYSKFKSKEAYQIITRYLLAQPDMQVPNADCFRAAFVRLKNLGLLKERPAPASEPTPLEPPPMEPTEAPPSDLVDGWDPESGEPRRFSPREIHAMSSTDYKKAFRLWATKDEDRRPKFTRSFFQ